MNKTKSAHHHGNLRQALINAGFELLREGGPDALSIRKAAARVGVSHAAPAHHFAALTDLRTAIVAEGFRKFAVSMETEIALAPDNPRDHILAASKGYISFAQENSSVFQLMFGGTEISSDDTALSEAAQAAYAVLARISAPVKLGSDRQQNAEAFVWSLVHGYASLMLANKIGFENNSQAYQQFERIFPDLEYFKPTIPV